MKNNKITIALIIIILLLLAGGFWYINSLKGDIFDAQQETRKEKIKNNELVKAADGYYRTLVADTLKDKELAKIAEKVLGENIDLKNEVKRKAKIVQQLELKIKDLQKPIDEVIVEGDTLSISDFYPNKDNPFVTYSNKISLTDKKGNATWSFGKIEVSIVIFQRADNLFEADVKVPEWIELGKVDIQATPLEPPKIDNFGFLIGGGYGKDFRTGGTDFIRLNGGIRYKKVYISLGASSNSTADIGINFEF